MSRCGFLALVVVLTQQGCASLPPASSVPSADEVRAKVHAVVERARAVSSDACDKAVPVCSAYYEAVKVGLVRDDDRAELACAGTATACELATE